MAAAVVMGSLQTIARSRSPARLLSRRQSVTQTFEPIFKLVLAEGGTKGRSGYREYAAIVATINIVETDRRAVSENLIRRTVRCRRRELLANSIAQCVPHGAALHEAKGEALQLVLASKEPRVGLMPECIDQMIDVETAFVSAFSFPRLPSLALQLQFGLRHLGVVSPDESKKSFRRPFGDDEPCRQSEPDTKENGTDIPYPASLLAVT